MSKKENSNLSIFKTIYEWEAPERVFTSRSRNWYVMVAIIAMFFIAYSALTNDLIFTFIIISLVLVVYALSSVPPQIIVHRITNKGINSFNSLYLWKSMLYFWVTKRGEEMVINIEFKDRPTDLYFKRMILLVGKGDLEKIVNLLLENVDYLNNKQGAILGKFVDGKYIPLLDIVKLEKVLELEEKREKDS